MSHTIEHYFAARGWTPAAFQRQAWQRYRERKHVLIHAPTGSGKTLAAWGAVLQHAAATPQQRSARGPRVLWITPLRALADNLVERLREPLSLLGLDWQIVARTGDASGRDRRLSRAGRVDVLVTTPESLALLMSYPETRDHWSRLDLVVVDEWHELLGSKRGVLLELMLAQLRQCAPDSLLWGMSATVGNLSEAADVLFASLRSTCIDPANVGDILHASRASTTASAATVPQMDIVLPHAGQRFAWAGHLGLSQLPAVVERLLAKRSSLLFTNTRGQAELWYQALASVWPESTDTLALHHGSLSSDVRQRVEHGLRNGDLRCVVATSSLDLGVDFPALEQIIQIGSPKSIARLRQRAGRAAHRPGCRSLLVCVPTHLLELLEFVAVDEALSREQMEARTPLRHCLDVLAQHIMTMAMGSPQTVDRLWAQVRSTFAFRNLDPELFRRTLEFLESGGSALQHYAGYRRLQRDADGLLTVSDKQHIMRHRLSIGTIVSDASVQVQMLRGGTLGSVEEGFLARLKPGDCFSFAGKTLELVQLRDLVARVRQGRGDAVATAVWAGGQLALSGEVALGVQRLLSRRSGWSPKHRKVAQIIAALQQTQAARSFLPEPGVLLVEWFERAATGAKDPAGVMFCLYPFAGRALHLALANLLAWRWGRRRANTFTISVNDYGLMLSPSLPDTLSQHDVLEWLSEGELLDDLAASVNLAELEQRQFREIARIAGLLPPNMPGRAPRSLRSLQTSSSLIFKTLREFDPDHLLIQQSRKEVLELQLQSAQLAQLLTRLRCSTIRWSTPAQWTPLAFPLWAERMRATVSTESWQDRVARIAAALEAQE